MHSTPVRAPPPVQPAAARREPVPPMPLPPPKRPRGRPRKFPVKSSTSQSTPQLEYDRSTPSASPSMQEHANPRPAPSSTSPPNSTLPPAGDVFDDPPTSRASPTLSDTAAPKRKRGRPRKYPYDANKEAARAAAKAAASITPWRRIAMIERPPVYACDDPPASRADSLALGLAAKDPGGATAKLDVLRAPCTARLDR